MIISYNCDDDSPLETYFKPESGKFPFERIYTCADSGQLHAFCAYGNNFFRERVPLYLLKSLHHHDCPYANVIAAIINLYTACAARVASTKMLLDFAATLKKPIKNICDGVNYKDHTRDICNAIAREDLLFVKVLVRYGVLRPDKSETPRDDGDCSMIVWYYIDRISSPPDTGRLPEIYIEIPTVKERLTALYKKIASHPELGIQLLTKETIIKLLHMLSLLTSLSDTVAECFQLYYEATTINFVTVREIQEFLPEESLICRRENFRVSRRLEEFLSPESEVWQRENSVTVEEIEEMIDAPEETIHVVNEKHAIEVGCNRLRSAFPESDFPQPRTLKHLSRCAVRAHLTERGVLPEVLAKLCLPDSIKEYLLITKAGS